MANTDISVREALPMTRHQRLFAALRGGPLDRVPVSAWMHFGSEHLSAASTAWLHEQFQRAYDWDWVKVMADYHFDVPADVLQFDHADSLDRLFLSGRDAPCFREQLACITLLQQTFGGEIPLFDSGYNPYQMLLRHIGHDQAGYLLAHADRTLRILEALTDAICAHIEDLKKLGITGYFHATSAAMPPGQARGMDDQLVQRFVRPFDLRILQAAQGMVRILHVHGSGIDLRRLAEYPFEVLHLADRDAKNPTLDELQRWTSACVMGGIDASAFSRASRACIADQIDDAHAQTRGRGFMLAPGCVVPSSSHAASLRFLRDYPSSHSVYRRTL